MQKRKEFPPHAVHVLRTAQQIHMSLSQMADQKANMLLAAAFLIFTVALGQAPRAEAQVALLIMGGAAFLAAALAVLAVMPATRAPSDGRTNLLFFGAFQAMPEEEYLDRVIEEVMDEEGSFRMMGRDMYQNGLVLARKKYRLLGYAYRIFLLGLIGSLVAFIVQFAL